MSKNRIKDLLDDAGDGLPSPEEVEAWDKTGPGLTPLNKIVSGVCAVMCAALWDHSSEDGRNYLVAEGLFRYREDGKTPAPTEKAMLAMIPKATKSILFLTPSIKRLVEEAAAAEGFKIVKTRQA